MFVVFYMESLSPFFFSLVVCLVFFLQVHLAHNMNYRITKGHKGKALKDQTARRIINNITSRLVHVGRWATLSGADLKDLHALTAQDVAHRITRLMCQKERIIVKAGEGKKN